MSLDVSDFEIEIEETSKGLTVVLCLANQEPTDQFRRSKTRNMFVNFVVSVCTACQLKKDVMYRLE